MLEAPAAGLLKLYGGAILLGGLVTGLLVAAPEIPLPSVPEAQTSVNVVMISILGYVLKEIRGINSDKKPKEHSAESKAMASSGVSAMILKKLEDLAFGTSETSGDVKEIAKEVKAHRLEFSDFRGVTETKFAEVDGKINVLNVKVALVK